MKNRIEAIRELLEEKRVAGILVEAQPNFHCLTGGRGFIGLNSETACASILVTRDRSYLVGNNIEGKRLIAEEIRSGFELLEYPWYDEGRKNTLIREACDGEWLRDADLAGWFLDMRTTLDDGEIDVYTRIGPVIAGILEEEMLKLRPGVAELDLAGALSARLWSENVEPVTLLIGFDDRLTQWRHLLPTGTKLRRRAIGSVAVRHRGLFISATRHVCFGDVPADIAARQQAVNRVNALAILGTRDGITMDEAFQGIVRAYEDCGYPGEWKHHHQGGLTGYTSRESKAAPGNARVIRDRQAYAWNPTIAGVKAEDTVLLRGGRAASLTHTGKWKYEEYEGLSLPGIMIV